MRRYSVVVLATFVAAAAVYLTISVPGLGMIDSGELTTVAQTLGIAHPTGYPLYTILGHVWLIIWPLSPDRGMVVFSVLCGAAACGVLARAAQVIFDKKVPGISPALQAIFPLAMTLGFALSPAAWNSVLYAEVYPLTWLIAALILWLAAKIFTPNSSPDASVRYALLLLYLCGLGLGNHLTIVWYAPIACTVLWRFARNSRQPVRVLTTAMAPIIVGATTILYLPIRSSLNPSLDWGNPESLPGLFRHVSAWQYRVWMFQDSFGSVVEKFLAFLQRIPGDIGWMTALLAILGVWLTVRRRVLFGYLILAVWLIGTVYNMNYDIPDISSYFLAFYCPLFVLAVMGARHVMIVVERCSWTPVWKSTAFALLILSVPVASALAGNHDRVRATYDFPRLFINEVIATLPDSALVFHGDWDVHSPFLYYRHVEKLRRDVVMLDIGLMQRSWYVEQERRNHPDIFRGSERQADVFLHAVEPFETGKPYDAQRLEAAFVELHNSIIREQLPRRPVYVRDVEELQHPGVSASYPKVPGGYFLRIAPDGAAQDPVFRAENVLKGGRHFSNRERRLLESAAQAALWQAHYARQASDTARMAEALNAAVMLNGDDPRVQAQVQRLRADAQARKP